MTTTLAKSTLEELSAEMKHRKGLANEAWKPYEKRLTLPTNITIGALIAVYALFVFLLFYSMPSSELALGYFGVAMGLMIPSYLLYAIFRSRVYAEFKKQYPEHYKVMLGVD